MSKMTVIQLLNKIANGEEVPKVIYFWERPYYFDKEYECYMYQCDGNKFIDLLDNHNDNLNCFLNDEVEIIEPQEHKIPEKLIPTSLRGIDNLDEKIEVAHVDTISAIDKINEIIDYLEEIE